MGDKSSSKKRVHKLNHSLLHWIKDALTIPRLLKRLTVLSGLCYIVLQHNQSVEHNHTYTLISFIAVVVWFGYDARRCEEESSKCRVTTEANAKYLRVSSKVMELVCDYDPKACLSLKRFEPVMKGSRCLFAKASNVWGSRDYFEGETLESNVKRSIPTLLQMLLRGEEEHIDGFLFEIRSTASNDFSNVDIFADAVRRVLIKISDSDPAGTDSARKSYIADKAWHFMFAGYPIFVTTFATCYDKTSSRYTYGADPRSGFVLLQPEYSFLHHDIPFDTPLTEWENPVTIRDRIRRSFADAGQKYFIPDTIHYPASEHVVKSLDGRSIVKWWEGSGL